MSADTAMRIAPPSGSGKAAAEPPAGEHGGFPAALTAARSGRPPPTGTHGHSDADDGGLDDPDDERDARTEASDPALAALAAALLPGAAPTDAGDQVEGTDALELVSSSRHRAASGSAAAFDATLDHALNEAPLSVGGKPEASAGRDLLQNLAREMALLREPTPSRSNAETRTVLPGEGLPASAATHAATQLAGISTMVTAAAAAATPEQALRLPVGAPRWADELGSRLVQMSMRGQQEGSLTLAPEHMGPLEVRISMNQNTAHIWFGAQHADTRAVLAETLPRLREMFAEAGLSLGHAGVSQEAPGQDAGRTLPLQRRLDEQLATQATTAPTEVSRPLSGLLDLYA